MPGQLVLHGAWLGTYVQTEHDDHEAVVGQGDIDLVHDQTLAIGEARLALDYGITKQFGVSVVVPVRFVSTRIRYLAKADGSEVDLVMPGIHHRNETLVGIADPMVLGAFSNVVGPLRVVLRGGLTLPLGSTEDNPFTPEAETMPHQHVQMGTGTFRPLLSADLSYPRGKWRFGGFVFTQQSIYENDRGFKAGDRYAAGLTVSRRLGKTWTLRGGGEVQGETAEHWRGIEHSDDGNRGRLDAMIVAGGSYSASASLAFDFTVKVPFVTHVVGGQLDMPAIVEVGATWNFGARAAPAHSHEGHDHAGHHHDEDGEHHDDAGDAHHDEHGEDHAEGHVDEPVVVEAPPITEPPVPDAPPTTEPTPAKPKPVARPAVKPDVAAYNKPGEAPDLVPVKGKLTIFDFWATWCGPCKTLDPILVDLARKYPDLVAIRKLDVVDWDSKAADRYLTPKGFDLPHLEIYDATGKRVLQKSSEPGKLQELIDQVKALVEAEAKKRPAIKATRIEIKADASGFSPSQITVKRGVPVTLRFLRTADKNCATEVIFEVDGKRIEKALPLNQPVEVTVTFSKPGSIPFECAMAMVRGTIVVQ